jgi:hypothetical protein
MVLGECVSADCTMDHVVTMETDEQARLAHLLESSLWARLAWTYGRQEIGEQPRCSKCGLTLTLHTIAFEGFPDDGAVEGEFPGLPGWRGVYCPVEKPPPGGE